MVLFMLGCGPETVPTTPDDDTGTTTGPDAGTSSSTASAPDGTGPLPEPDTTSSGSTSVGDENDQALCLAECLNANALGCTSPFAGELCYSRCIDDLQRAAEDGCLEQWRDIIACEGQASSLPEIYCESYECEDEYKRHDICLGRCGHLGGNPGGGSSQTECRWRGTSCYGHEFEVLCDVDTPEALCDCIVDERVVSQCEHGTPLAAFTCDDSIHIFTSCCLETFEEVLFP